MPLAEILQGLGFFAFPDSIENVLRSHNLEDDAFVREYFVASAGEAAIMSHCARSFGLPVVVPDELPEQVIYKVNCATFESCSHGEDARPEYLFLYLSDLWKMRRLMSGQTDSAILSALLTNPARVLQRIRQSGWKFAPGQDAQLAAQLHVLLWSAKARLIQDHPSVSAVEAHTSQVALTLGFPEQIAFLSGA
jgi:hypothetical protein